MVQPAPDVWQTVKIGDLCKVGRGSSPRPIRNQEYFRGGTIPWIKIADATKSGKYLYETKQYVNEYGASFSRLMPKGSLVVAASGTLGYTQLLGVKGCIHDGWLYLEEFSDSVNKDFLYYLFKHRVQFFYNSAYGAAIQNVNTTILREMEISLPPVATQRKISAVLSAYDDLIENNTRRIAILEEMAQALYREWFVHFRFPGHEDVQLVEVEGYGRVPEGWKWSSLSELLPNQKKVVQTGPFGSKLHASDYRDKGVPLILVKHIKNGYVDENNMPLVGEHKLDELEQYRLQEGDIVVSRVGYVGAAAYVYPKFDNWFFSGQTLRVRLPENNMVDARFLSQFYLTEYFKSMIENVAVGATRLSLNTKILSDFAFLVPPIELQRNYVEKIMPVDGLVMNLRSKNEVLRQTRDLLLPRLISGELDVSDLEIELPDAVSV